MGSSPRIVKRYFSLASALDGASLRDSNSILTETKNIIIYDYLHIIMHIFHEFHSRSRQLPPTWRLE
jgi:hypothetical protein